MPRSPEVVPPLALPDARSAANLGLRLSKRQLALIRKAMSIHAASRKPRLTWRGWHAIAVACAIAADQLKKTSGHTRTPTYTRAMSVFLKRTGFIHLSKDDRACALRLLPHWDTIDAWRATLPPARQQTLNNPREVDRAYRKRASP